MNVCNLPFKWDLLKSTHYSDSRNNKYPGPAKMHSIFYHPGSRQGEEEKKKTNLRILKQN